MDKTLEIRFTSDTHGYLYPTSYADTQDRPMGLMKVAAEFPHDGNTLILDGGDTIQGSPMTNLYYRLSAQEKAECLTSDAYGSHPFAAMMNLAGYQYVTLGNHDFNYGVDELGEYLGNLDAICLCANIRDKAHALPIAPYAIHQLENGLRIGLVGACTQYVAQWEHPDTIAQLDIEDPVEAAGRALDEIKSRCDVTVLLYHGGFECDLETGELLTDSTENLACKICRELDFDLVLTGHQHMRVDGVRFGNSYAVQPGFRAPHACGVTVTVHDNGTKDIASRIVEPADVPLAGAPELLTPLEDRVQKWLDAPVGHLDRDLCGDDHLDAAINGSYLANFINTVQQAVTGAQITSNALANEVKGLPMTVTVRDVVSTYIYTNTLVVLELTGAELRSYIERSAEYFTLMPDGSIGLSDTFIRPKVQHYNYDFFSGLDYTIDVRRPPKQRVTSMRLPDGHEIADDEKVSVAINSYRSHGTSGYEMLLGKPILADVQVDVADAIIDYITQNPSIAVDTHKYCTVLG